MHTKNDEDPDHQDAIKWLESLQQYMPRQKTPNQWDKILSERNTYLAAYQTGGIKLVVTLVFCELFMAHCIEVRNQSDEGKSKHLYKIRKEIDVSLLNEIEQVVARCLMNFSSLQSLIEQASSQLANGGDVIKMETSSLTANRGQVQDIRNLSSQYQEIIAEAASINPTTSNSGCN